MKSFLSIMRLMGSDKGEVPHNLSQSVTLSSFIYVDTEHTHVQFNPSAVLEMEINSDQ